MIAILLTDPLFEQDIRELLMAFYPGETYTHSEEEAGQAFLILRGGKDPGRADHFTLDLEENGAHTALEWFPDFSRRTEAKNEIKRGLYDCLRKRTGKTLPWGTLTGIRPTKIALGRLAAGESRASIAAYMKETYETGDEKIRLCVDVAAREHEILRKAGDPNGYSLYVGIPFCPTTCLYCSFTSFPIGKWEKRMDEYLGALFRELEYAAGRMRERKLTSVYVGGGTPTALSAADLERVLSRVRELFPVETAAEFTVEAGRPDSITPEKLSVLKRCGVTRISINPQTMKQETLDLIGRRHTTGQVKEQFYLARELGFDNINMDLIAGLPGETIGDLARTMDEIAALSPDGVTVHSLAIKRASRLNLERERYGAYAIVNTQEMIDLTARRAAGMGLFPYYLYRQKNMAGNFENVGYAAPGRECVYNILIMEEQQTIVGCGAGTTTKVLYPSQNRLERAENVKEVEQYIARTDEMIARKDRLLAAME